MTMQQPAEIQLQQVVAMLARRRRLILAMGIFGAALAGIVGLVIPAKYTAKAQVVVESQAGAIGGSAGAAGTVDEMAIETHVTMLTSRDHLQRVSDILVAGPLPPAVPVRAQGEAGATGGAASSPASEIGTPTLEELEQNLMVYQERKGRVIAVTYTSTSPAESAAIANQIARLYAERHADRQRADKRNALVEQQLTALNHQLSMARSDFAARQARLASLQDRQRREGGTAALIESLDSAVLTEFQRDQIALLQSQTELAATLPRTHPDVQSVAVKLQELQQKIDREIDRIVKQLEDDTEIAGARVRSLQQRLETMQVAARSEAREQDVYPRELQRDATAGPQLSESLLRHQRETGEQPEFLPGVRILSLADPPVLPSSPNPILFVFPALVIFSIAGGFLAMVLEGLDRGLRSERDIKDALGISCLGLVPQLHLSRKLRVHQYMLRNPFAAYTEAIRSVVVAALELNSQHRAPKVFLVTSSVPGEGKTTLAVSFAAYAARLQRRVLLVDLAFRSPAVLRELGVSADGGVLEVLQGQPLGEMIKNAPELAIDYLPLPHHSIDPLTLVGSTKLPELLHQVRESYDCVVIDSSPLLGTTEARLLVPMVDKVLFAVKWGSTQREVAQHAINLLGSAYSHDKDPAAFASAVVTQVDLKQHARYRHGDVAEVLARKDRYLSRTGAGVWPLISRSTARISSMPRTACVAAALGWSLATRYTLRLPAILFRSRRRSGLPARPARRAAAPVGR